MKNKHNKRPVPISYANSDEVRVVHVPEQVPDAVEHSPPSQTDSSPGTSTASTPQLKSSATSQPPASETTHDAVDSSDRDVESVGTESGPNEASSATAGQKGTKTSKPKVTIETLEQFIEYAYSRKGQRVILKPKVEKAIAQNPRLDDGALSRLLALAAGDAPLAVPRQLLLLSREIEGYPALRSALGSFVSTVMLRHPAFADAKVQGALRNLPEALSAAEALTKVATFSPADEDDKEPLKSAELQALRHNAAHLFACWLASNRGMNAEELATLLFQVMWSPAASELSDDNARLRALTEIEQLAGVGLACQRFRQQAIEARSSQDHALREANELRLRLAETETYRSTVEEQRDALQAELEALRERTAAEIAELRRVHDVERTHLHHGQEQLGGRLVRRLDDAVETLEVGLSALRNKTPRVEVMLERAELVVDALKAEIKNLRED
jgi:hypothetical protein